MHCPFERPPDAAIDKTLKKIFIVILAILLDRLATVSIITYHILLNGNGNKLMSSDS
jgi:hypothetical protein